MLALSPLLLLCPPLSTAVMSLSLKRCLGILLCSDGLIGAVWQDIVAEAICRGAWEM